jgi:peptidoglycan biosynthesis protein MviN/MurJ (putative lipid II flippase)
MSYQLLTKIFIGKVGDHLFSLTTLTSRYGAMWGFGIRERLADKFPWRCERGGYKIYIGLYMAVIVSNVVHSITEQQWIQMAFLTARIVMVIMMVGTVVAAYVADEPHFASQDGPVNDIPLKPSNTFK